ncbi:VOC family protein [Rhizobium ruizarguesonis]|uniref:VOC family protein n=1 Tax=Rhizobium ruizarguesonis TaxID=2081791 RepID=UPI001639E6CC|nr:VOC family protein [Rhizobium ruizarguesonis]MBC2807008.1 VOC family protein [Rhizobium ruizarguesonis]
MNLVGLDHFAVNVKNLADAEAWYGAVFNFHALHRWSGVTMVGTGNIRVGLFETPDGVSPGSLDHILAITHVAFLVDGDKFQSAIDELRSHGLTIEGPEDTGIAFSIFIEDLDHNKIELTTYHGAGCPMPH